MFENDGDGGCAVNRSDCARVVVSPTRRAVTLEQSNRSFVFFVIDPPVPQMERTWRGKKTHTKIRNWLVDFFCRHVIRGTPGFRC